MDSSPVTPAATRAVASRLNRRMSFSIPQNSGFTRLRFWAKTVARLLPAHSRRRSSTRTENDISDATDATPR